MRIVIILTLMLCVSTCPPTFAQATVFTYQGKVTDAGTPANGFYDFEFRLFDALSGGTQIGPTNPVNSVQVVNGIFTVQLDFGLTAFSGAPRFLGISVRATGAPSFTLLTPRQQVSSNPYAIRSLNAGIADGLSIACVSCVTSSQIASVSGSSVTGPIPVASVPAGSGNYVQNTTSQQAGSNFNISGNGTAGGTLSANTMDAATQYNIAGARAFTVSSVSRNVFAGVSAGVAGGFGGSNSFFGHGAGELTASGADNSFFGRNSGNANTASNNSFFGSEAGFGNSTGTRNSFFGRSAGRNNDVGNDNAVFGYRAGSNNTTSFNSFFGSGAGDSTTTGPNNAFFGYNAGQSNLTGSSNAFFGYNAGALNTASLNSFFGANAGDSNTTGTRNSFFGRSAGTSVGTANDNSFFGYNAGIVNTASDNSFFGSGAGDSNTTGTKNSFFGQSAGSANTDGDSNSFFGYNTGKANTGSFNSFFGTLAGVVNTNGHGNSIFGSQAGFTNTTGSENAFFGDAAGYGNSSGTGNVALGSSAGAIGTGDGNTSIGFTAGYFVGTNNTSIGYQAGFPPILGNAGTNNTTIGANTSLGANTLDHATDIGANAVVSSSNTIALGRNDGSDLVEVYGRLQLDTIGPASNPVCYNSANRIGSCSSSLRYKTQVAPFLGGLDIVRRLRPISFTWIEDGKRDLGLGAEEVARVEALLTFRNKEGRIEGVRYNQVSAVLINAVNEQEAQITKLRHTIEQQEISLKRLQRIVESFTRLVCRRHPYAKACKGD